MEFAEIRQQVLDTTHKLCDAGLIRLSAGNVSARHESGIIAITPTSVPYDEMKAEDIVIVDLEGRVIEGKHRPSSETPMHTAIMKALPNVHAVVHTHSIYAMALSVAGRSLPVIITEGLLFGGTVPVARYATPATLDAGVAALEEIEKNPMLKAVLLRNHGLVAFGSNLTAAWETAYKVEIQAQVYHLALQMGQAPAYTPDQIADIYAAYVANRRGS